ncbi:hypothetical protein [Brevibacterium litoralis]|uniref:hypothetical protein n=1 Tax=Brevibacterium litoralis TaxID=3138935 RepID=UPI0032EE82E4
MNLDAATAHDAEADLLQNAADQERGYSQEIREAAAAEAEEAGMQPEDYLDHLDEAERESLLDESRRGIEDSMDRDERIEKVSTAAAAEDRAETFEHRADLERDAAADARVEAEMDRGHSSETPAVSAAHSAEMNRHLETVAATSPEAQNAIDARRTALLNVPENAKGSFKDSLNAKTQPKKGVNRQQKAGREMERTW